MPASTPDKSEQQQPAGEQDAKGEINILLVEDSRMNRQVALHILRRKLGYKADTASDGHEALEALKQKKYDLVLMDCQMPGMDGYAATRTIRDPASKVLDHHVRIVAITANAMQGDREKCMEAGMDDYVTKPVRPNELAAVVRRNLPGHDATQSAVQPIPEQNPEAIASEWANDPELAKILDDFVASLPTKLAAMRDALDNGRYEDLQRIAHQLKGAGGGYGYPALTESARGLENAAKAKCKEAALGSLTQLTTLCRAVEAGHQATINERGTQS